MKKSYGRIIAGVLFTALGATRVATEEGSLLILMVCMMIYGLFSIGYGVYLYRKGE